VTSKPKITILPPAPQETHFQEYQFDEYLGKAPGLTTGLDLTSQEGPSTIEEQFGKGLRGILDEQAYRKRSLERLAGLIK